MLRCKAYESNSTLSRSRRQRGGTSSNLPMEAQVLVRLGRELLVDLESLRASEKRMYVSWDILMSFLS